MLASLWGWADTIGQVLALIGRLLSELCKRGLRWFRCPAVATAVITGNSLILECYVRVYVPRKLNVV